MSEIEAVIKRLMKYCERANKEVTQSIERRQLVMDIEMIYSGLMEQRDAALKLADKWRCIVEAAAINPASHMHDVQAYDVCTNELRAIFAPKEGK